MKRRSALGNTQYADQYRSISDFYHYLTIPNEVSNEFVHVPKCSML